MRSKNIILVQTLGALTEPSVYLCPSYLEPITLEYLAAYLESKGYETKILAGNVSERSLIDSIRSLKPIAVGFSIYTYTYPESLRLAKAVKACGNELGYTISTIFGGYHASALPAEIIKNKNVDFVVAGEGEITLCELLESLINGSSFHRIEGIYFKENGKIVQTPPRNRINNLDTLPLSKRIPDFILNAKVHQLMYPSLAEQRSVARISYSRGCPFACSYCSSKNIWNQQIKWRSAKNVVDEIEQLHNKYRTNLVSFLDLTFNADRKKTFEICDEFIQRDLPVYWWGLFRLDLLDDKILERLAQAKCVKINVGLESPNITLANKVKNQHHLKKEKLLDNLRLADKHGLLIRAYIIIGFEDETEKAIKLYDNILTEYPIDELRVTFATPFPSTQMWKNYVNKGLLPLNPKWHEFTTETPIIKHPTLSRKKLLHLRKNLVKNFYLNNNYHDHVMHKVQKYPYFKNSFLDFLKFLGKNILLSKKNENLKSLIKDIKKID